MHCFILSDNFMIFTEVPNDVTEKIIRHCCLKEQRNLCISCKYFHDLLYLKLQMYKNETNHILNYIRLLHNKSLAREYAHELNVVVQHIVFRESTSRIKITLHRLIKLNYSYKIDNDGLMHEKIQVNYYFSNISELIAFVYIRILSCNMYSNVLLFSQKYHYYKVY